MGLFLGTECWTSEFHVSPRPPSNHPVNAHPDTSGPAAVPVLRNKKLMRDFVIKLSAPLCLSVLDLAAPVLHGPWGVIASKLSACSIPFAASSSPFPGAAHRLQSHQPSPVAPRPLVVSESIHRGLCKMQMGETLPGLLRWSREAALPHLRDRLR